ncbi:unnamed protein product [Musa hybrid cultivar]
MLSSPRRLVSADGILSSSAAAMIAVSSSPAPSRWISIELRDSVGADLGAMSSPTSFLNAFSPRLLEWLSGKDSDTSGEPSKGWIIGCSAVVDSDIIYAGDVLEHVESETLEDC